MLASLYSGNSEPGLIVLSFFEWCNHSPKYRKQDKKLFRENYVNSIMNMLCSCERVSMSKSTMPTEEGEGTPQRLPGDVA